MAIGSLTGATPAATYKSLLKVQGTNQVLDSTLRVVEDGDGNDSSMKLTITGSTYGASFVGNIGIGTDTPDEELVVKSSGTGDGNHPTIKLQTSETDIEVNDVIGRFQWQAPDEGTGTDADDVCAEIYAYSEGDFSSSNNATTLAFRTASSGSVSSRLFIKSDGKVGIGTDTPDAQLEIVKENADCEVMITCYDDTNTDYSKLQLRTSDNTEASPAAVDSGDTLGAIQFLGHDGSAFGYGAAIVSAATENYSGSAHGAYLAFSTVDNTTTSLDERMRIDQNGYVGIGTTAPGAKLQLGLNESGENVYLECSSNTNAASGIIMSVNGSGKWSLRNDSADQLQVYDYGDSSVAMHIDTTEDEWGSGSDSRIKENVENIGSVLAKLNSLNPVTYQRKYSDSDKSYAGLIAQEVKSDFPLLVVGTEDSFKEVEVKYDVLDDDGNFIEEGTRLRYEGGLSLKYAKFVPYLIKAIQELSAKVTALENA
tara:strand:- start:596 stop:2041 length:1446 start_codon:yes stop_codon:yes gene_type:complete